VTDQTAADWEVPTRSSVLVTGPSEDTLDGVVEHLVGTRAGTAGGLVVSTRDGTVDLHEARHGALASFAEGAAGLVDCTPGTATGADRERLRWRVSSPTAFTSIGMAVSDGLAALAERGVEVPWVVLDTLSTPTAFTSIGMAVSDGLAALAERGVEVPWVVLDTLSTPLVSTDATDVIRFAHAVHAQVTARGGVAVFPVYTNVTTGTDLERCKHLANVQVDVRKRGGRRRARVRGLDSAPAEWMPLGSTDAAANDTGMPDVRAP